MRKTSSRTLATVLRGAFASAAFAACGTPSTTTAIEETPQPRVAELVRHSTKAKAVFVGEVVAIEHRLSQPDTEGRVVPFQFVTWRVDRAIRGVEAGATWTGRFAGGPFGDGRTLSVSEVPEIELGQRALLLADDGDAGACALVGCRNGMLLVSDAHGRSVDDASLDRVIAALDDGPGASARARSVDPDLPFAFAMPLARSPNRTARTAQRPPSSRSDVTSDAERTELDSMSRNGRNPVIR